MISKKLSGKMLLIIIFSAVLLSVCTARKTDLFPVFSEDESVALPVLMYHCVLPDASKTKKYVVTPQKFEEDLIYLEEKGYQTVSVKQLVRYVYNDEPLPEKPVVITFDDGMYNNYEYIVPILKKHNACAVFSVVGSYTDEYTESNIVHPSYSYLRWSDIRELAETPYVEFGNHSYAFHTISASRYGTQKNKDESPLDYINVFYQDTEKMQSEFYSNCSFRPIIYTYPFGSYSRESSRVLKKMGFLVTFGCTEGINRITHDEDCLYLLKRYNRDGRLSTRQFFSKLKL